MRRHVLIPLIVACALFMENMDSTVLATSLPAIAADIGEQPLALKFALTSYLVGLAIFIPICSSRARSRAPHRRHSRSSSSRASCRGSAAR